MKTAIIAGALLAFGLSPSWAQTVGDQVTCTGTLTNIDVQPPNRISFNHRDLKHVGYFSDESGKYRCTIDRDGVGDLSQWRCNARERCRVVGIIASIPSDLLLIIRHGKRVNMPNYVVLDVLSAEPLESGTAH